MCFKRCLSSQVGGYFKPFRIHVAKIYNNGAQKLNRTYFKNWYLVDIPRDPYTWYTVSHGQSTMLLAMDFALKSLAFEIDILSSCVSKSPDLSSLPERAGPSRFWKLTPAHPYWQTNLPQVVRNLHTIKRSYIHFL